MRAKSVDPKSALKTRNGLTKTVAGKIVKTKKSASIPLLAKGAKKLKKNVKATPIATLVPSAPMGPSPRKPGTKPNNKKLKSKEETPKVVEDKVTVKDVVLIKPKAKVLVSKSDVVNKVDGKVINNVKVKIPSSSARTKKVVNNVSVKDEVSLPTNEVLKMCDDKTIAHGNESDVIVKKKSPVVRSKEKSCKNKIATPKKAKLLKSRTVCKVSSGPKSKKMEPPVAKSQAADLKSYQDTDLDARKIEEPPKAKTVKTKVKELKKIANGAILQLQSKKSVPKKLPLKKGPVKKSAQNMKKTGGKSIYKAKKERKKNDSGADDNNDSSTSDELPLDMLAAREKNGFVIKPDGIDSELLSSKANIKYDEDVPLKKETGAKKQKKRPAKVVDPREGEPNSKPKNQLKQEIKKEVDSSKVKSKPVKTEVIDESVPLKEIKAKKTVKIKEEDGLKKGKVNPEEETGLKAPTVEDSKTALELDSFGKNLLNSMKKEFCDNFDEKPIKIKDKATKLQKTKKNIKAVVKKLKPKALKTKFVAKKKQILAKKSPKCKASAIKKRSLTSKKEVDKEEDEKAFAKDSSLDGKIVTYNGARRHRVASLNAIAKVHCLYENESRGALNEIIQDNLIQLAESGNERSPVRVLKKINAVSKRILRNAPGIRSVGQHWDMNDSSSSDSPMSSSSEDEVKIRELTSDEEPPSPEEQRKPVKKRRRENESKMDLKDMVVHKRMASLNASAILAASYSVEKRTTSSTVSVRAEAAPKRKSNAVPSSTVSSKESSNQSPNKQKVAVIVTQDTDVTITGVYSSRHEEYNVQYRISSTSHTQTKAVSAEALLHAECDPPPSSTAPPPTIAVQQQPPPCKTYTPLNALSSMQPPGNQTGTPPARCNSAFSAPPNFPSPAVSHKDPPYIHGYYQPAGPLISSHHHHHHHSSVSNLAADPSKQQSPQLTQQTPPPTPTRSVSDTTENEVIISSSSCNAPSASCHRYPPHQSPYPYTYPTSFYPSPPAANSHQYHSQPPIYHQELCYPHTNPSSTSPAPPTYFYHHKTSPYVPPPPSVPPTYHRRYVGPHPHPQPPPAPPQYYTHQEPYPIAYYSSSPSNPPTVGSQQQMIVTAGPVPPLENYAPPPAPPPSHTPTVDPYPPPPAYYPAYNGPAPPPCYSHSPPSRSIAFIDSAYQSCPCPMQSCPKNVHTGPLTGASKGSLNKSSTTLPPVVLALPSEPPCVGASGPPSPARGSAGIAPPTTSELATARNPLNHQQWSCDSSVEKDTKPENETGLLTISRVLSDCISDNFSLESKTDLKQEEEELSSYASVKEVPPINLEVKRFEEKPSNIVVSRKRKKITIPVAEEPILDVEAKVQKLNNEVTLNNQKECHNIKHRIENLTNPPAPPSIINNDLSSTVVTKLAPPKISNSITSNCCKILKMTKCLKNKLDVSLISDSSVTQQQQKLPSLTKMPKKSRVSSDIKSRRKSYNLLTNNNLNHLAMDSKKRRKSINSLSTDISIQNVDLIIKNSEVSSTIDCHQVAQDLGIVADCRILETNNNDRNQNWNKISSLQLAINSNCKQKKSNTKIAKSDFGFVSTPPPLPVLAVVPQTKEKQIPDNLKKIQQRKNSTNSKGCSKTEQIVPASISKKPTSLVNSCQELVPISSLKKSLPTLKWSNGWSWEGQPFKAKVYLTNDNPPVLRKCYPAMRHIEGDMISARDCILLKSGPRKIDLPFVAKVSSLWENPEDGEMMVSLLWYYRPEHTEQGRRSEDTVDEIFASRHKDTNSVACIEDKCYVLTYNEYCRYRKSIKRIEESVYKTNSVVPAPEDGRYPRINRLPPGRVAPDLIFFCRRVYDFKQKRILKNPC